MREKTTPRTRKQPRRGGKERSGSSEEAFRQLSKAPQDLELRRRLDVGLREASAWDDLVGDQSLVELQGRSPSGSGAESAPHSSAGRKRSEIRSNSDHIRADDRSVGDATSLRTAIGLFDAWALTHVQASELIGASQESLVRARAGQPEQISDDCRTRLARLLSVQHALSLIFKEPRHRTQWLNAPNSAFEGRSALDVMLSGAAGIERVRRYLEVELNSQ